MSSRVVPVGLLVSYVKELLDTDALLADVWIEGEVSQVFHARSGHLYFSLKDDDVTLKCVLFRTLAERQSRLPEVGDALVAHGRLGLYARDGTVQLYADVVQAAGLGVLALQFEQLRQRLEAEGLFEETRKRPLPARPRVIGVVTSPDGSVWHDIQQVLRRRFPLVEVVLAPALVQGRHAPDSITLAIGAIQRVSGVEVVILGRGGGSADDLSAFNDERVARAVFASSVPVVSAVGHETDWTIVDFVADARAATPSVAAELCVPSRADLIEQLDIRRRVLRGKMLGLTSGERAHWLQQRDRLKRIDFPADIAQRQTVLTGWRRLLDRYAQLQVVEQSQHLARQRAVLETLGPDSVLRRGYALVVDPETGTVVSTANQAANSRSLDIEFFDRTISANPDPASIRTRDGKENPHATGTS